MPLPLIRYYCLNCDFEMSARNAEARANAYTVSMNHAAVMRHIIDWQEI